jgi:hypothetical protein
MIDLIPYFAGLITLLFGFGFIFAIKAANKRNPNNKNND